MKTRWLISLIAAVLLAACAPERIVPPTLPAPTDTALPPTVTTVPTSTARPTVAPTNTLRPTPSGPITAPTRTPLPCSELSRRPVDEGWTWETVELDGQSLRHLTGIRRPIVFVDPSPVGRYLVVGSRSGSGGGVSQLSVALVDTQSDAQFWLNTGTWGFEGPHAWLPDGTLVWPDEQGCVHRWSGGDAFENLTPPGAARKVQVASGEVVFFPSPNYLPYQTPGRLDLRSGALDLLTLPTDSEDDDSRLDVAIASSGEWALGISVLPIVDNTLYPRDLYRIPASPGAPPEYLSRMNLYVLARGGGRFIPYTQLAGGPYWFGPLPVYMDEPPGNPVEGFIVDVRSGQLVPSDTFPLPGDYRVYGYEPSPDGRYLAVLLYDPADIPYQGPVAVYLTPADDFSAGHIIEADVVSTWTPQGYLKWHPDDAVIMRAPNGEWIVQQLPVDEHPIAALVGAGDLIAIVPGRILTTGDSPAVVNLYHVSSARLATLDLRDTYSGLSTAARSGSTIYLAVGHYNPATERFSCPCGLIEWADAP